MTDDATTPAPEPPTPEPEPVEAPAPPPTALGPLSDPDGDGVPGISWSASAVIIVIIITGGALLFAGKIPEEVLILLMGSFGENVRGKLLSGKLAKRNG